MSYLSIYYTWKNIKSAYNNNKLKISAPTWNDEFDLSDGSYSIADIYDYFEFIIKKHETGFFLKVKTGYKLELLSAETIKLLGSTKKDVNQDKDGEDVPILESVEVVLVHWNLVNNNYQQASKVAFTSVSNKQFGQLINIPPHSLIMLSTRNTEFSSIEVWFTDQNSESLEIEDGVNLTLIIG